ncbi:putative acetyltransferase [Nocardioides zeae]|uniref:Acetyltransferase n=1 Tax=Nocardioides zeae TaxID=1457234 RepID=A0ACC6IL70_9ACTN|nr:GNAT family N-acetyltransferase [Nocardioides zeae]MDR6175130.1 putative acetyltransferase [Nocardioides zeae]MDR6211377.1 putative acetyltransferase [Nocardioides zeae]
MSPAPPPVTVSVDPDLTARDVRALLEAHLADMRAVSPPESVHALDLDELRDPAITFCVARTADGTLLGVGALKELDDPTEPGGHGEVKSMRTAPTAVRTGVASQLLAHLLDLARSRGLARVSLETGAEPFFAPARRFYARHGFVECGPFADYAPDPNSVFMTRPVAGSAAAPAAPPA